MKSLAYLLLICIASCQVTNKKSSNKQESPQLDQSKKFFRQDKDLKACANFVGTLFRDDMQESLQTMGLTEERSDPCSPENATGLCHVNLEKDAIIIDVFFYKQVATRGDDEAAAMQCEAWNGQGTKATYTNYLAKNEDKKEQNKSAKEKNSKLAPKTQNQEGKIKHSEDKRAPFKVSFHFPDSTFQACIDIGRCERDFSSEEGIKPGSCPIQDVFARCTIIEDDCEGSVIFEHGKATIEDATRACLDAKNSGMTSATLKIYQ